MEPEIHAMLSPSDIEVLKKIEITYQTARRLFKKNKDNDSLTVILNCGVEVIELLDILEISNMRKDEITALKIGIRILMASLSKPGDVDPDI